MPGIMPMKIIKVGSAAQSRVAQACDRCRSKKIRCDGITPCCSQCANVGFECKTSDKLSRRAFPRGYTESLEERVRQLECEVRDLKGLLDEKDEKIDLLSKFHDFSTRRPSIAGPTTKQENLSPSGELDESEVFSVKNPNNLLRISTRCEPHWAGASSSSAYLDVFKSKAAAAGRAVPPVSPRALFSVKGITNKRPAGGHARRPPRLVSDRLVNVYLQEFAPFLPVLYRPAFLQRYKEFADGFDDIENHHVVAQLNLVFSIASTACDFGREHVSAFDNHWQSALNAVIHDNSLASLQCLILAQLCCLVKGDSNRVLHYAGIAVIMSRRLGLHRAQANLQLDPLTTETRKRTFWCLYTLDTFTAANLGLPRLIKDEIVQTEAPINVDDEDLFESRLSSPNPETKMSAALAFFDLSRIFARIIDSVYQSPFEAGVALSTISQLSEDLTSWRETLAPHLRLVFVQDKPSTRVTGDRSPLLSLAYWHARALLYRPLATSDLGAKAVPGVIALADACKHIVQIAQLLDERHMSFSLPMNKHEVLVNAGLGLLYQGLTLQGGSSLVNDSQRLVCAVISILDNVAAPCATDFKALACSLITVDGFARRRTPSTKESVSPRSSVSMAGYGRPRSLDMTQPQTQHQSQHQRRQSKASTSPTTSTSLGSRRANFPGKLELQENHNALYAQSAKMPMLTPMRSEPILRKTNSLPVDPRSIVPTGAVSNLDYLPLGEVTHSPSPIPGSTPSQLRAQNTDFAGTPWDRILGVLNDNPNLGTGNGSTFESTAKSSPMDIFGDQLSLHTAVDGTGSWTDPASATAWGTDTTSVPSVFDDSEASFTSGEDRTSLDLGRGQTMGKDMNAFGGLGMGADGLVDEFSAALPGMEDGLAF